MLYILCTFKIKHTLKLYHFIYFFATTWEQHKLNEIINYTSSSLTATDALVEGKFDLYDANSKIGKVNKHQMNIDYITIIKDGAGVGRVRKLPKYTAFIGTMGALTPQNSSLDFIYTIMNKIDLSKKYSGSTIPHIYFKDYGEEFYYIPKVLEQYKIGEFFNKIDTLISLHQ